MYLLKTHSCWTSYTPFQFQSLGHDTDDGDADWAGPARENGENGGPVLGPKSFGRAEASAEAAAS